MTTIITKNSSTASAVPLAADLVQGELAVNVTDKRLFTQNASDVVVELGTNPSSVTTASVTITGGTVNGTAVGATTPSTGAFTTLSATGLITTNGQVKFPSSQNASADANTLDDYEEGIWTPQISASAGSITSYTSAGQYTKVGNLVTVTGIVTVTNNGTGSNALTLGGLPFASGPGTAACGVARIAGTTGNTCSINLGAGTTAGQVWTYNNTYPVATGAAFPFTLTYQMN